MALILKLRSVRKGIHMHTTIFSGEEGQALANTGTLIQTVGEWSLFGAALLLGARQMAGVVNVIQEGPDE